MHIAKEPKMPVEVLYYGTWDTARNACKRRILNGYRPLLIMDAKKGQWKLEVYD